MKNRFFTGFIICILFSLNSYAQRDSSLTSRKYLTVGLTYNPFLSVIDKQQEAGISVAYAYRINKRFETGINWFSRQVLYTPDNSYRQFSNLKSGYNLESVYSIYFGINFSGRKFTHSISLAGGVRHDLYKETLNNPQYKINQVYKNSEWNAVFGLGYTCRYHVSAKSAISLRLFMPLNRHPFDDIKYYSIEPGFVFKL